MSVGTTHAANMVQLGMSAERRAIRHKHAGASESPVIVGVSPFKRNAADLYYEKTHPLTEEKAPSAVMEAGLLLEAPILQWYEQQTGYKTVPDVYRIADDGRGLLSASHDALVIGEPIGVEIKTSGLAKWTQAAEWGKPDTDEIPAYVAVQCYHQMYVSNLQRVDIPVLLGDGRMFQLYHLDRDDENIAQLVKVVNEFWDNHIIPRIPPPLSECVPHMETLRRIQRIPDKLASIPEDKVAHWLACKAQVGAAKQAADEAEAAIVASMGDAEGFRYGDRVHVWAVIERKGYTVAAANYRRWKQIKEHKGESYDFTEPAETGAGSTD